MDHRPSRERRIVSYKGVHHRWRVVPQVAALVGDLWDTEGMFKVELNGRVRRAVLIEGLSQRAVAREFGLYRKTIRKMLAMLCRRIISGSSR